MGYFFAGEAMVQDPGSPVPMLMLLGCLIFAGLVRLLVLQLAGRKEQKKRHLMAAYAAIAVGICGVAWALVLYWSEKPEWADIWQTYATMIFIGAGFLGVFGGSAVLLHTRPAGGKPQQKIRLMEALVAVAIGLGGVITAVILRPYQGSIGIFICLGLLWWWCLLILIAAEIVVNLIRCIKMQTRIHKIAAYAVRAVGVGVIITTAVMILIEPGMAFFILLEFVYGALAFLAIEIVTFLIRCIVGIVNRLRAKKRAVI